MEKYNRALGEGEDQLTNVDRHVLNGLHWVYRCEENDCMQRTTFLKCHLQIDSEGSVYKTKKLLEDCKCLLWEVTKTEYVSGKFHPSVEDNIEQS